METLLEQIGVNFLTLQAGSTSLLSPFGGIEGIPLKYNDATQVAVLNSLDRRSILHAEVARIVYAKTCTSALFLRKIQYRGVIFV